MTQLSSSTAGTLSAIDLSRIPFPDFLAPKSYEVVLDEMINDVQTAAIKRTDSPYIFHEADPAYIVLEACAQRRWRDLADHQQQVKNMLVAYATKEYLDHLGANPDFKCERLLIVEPQPNATPPVAAVYEPDDSYRLRLTLSNEGYTSAGSAGAYLFHTLSASGEIRDASVDSPLPGIVEIRLLSHDGMSSFDLITTVATALNSEKIRPICDQVQVYSANIEIYDVTASVVTYPGADAPSVMAAAKSKIQAYVDAHYKIGHDITRSGLAACAMVEGAQNVLITSPNLDLVTDLTTARQCANITLTHVGAQL